MMNEELDTQIESVSPKYKLLFIILGCVVIAQILFGFAIYSWHAQWAERGQFGDMFGAVNTLFSGMAFAGVIYTIYLQRNELKLQRFELKLTRLELNRSATAQENSEQALTEQVMALNRQTEALYGQVSAAAKATKMQIAVSLIDQLYSDKLVQETLELILADNVEFTNENGVAVITCTQESKKKSIYLELNILLNRFQVLGQLFHLDVLDKEDLRGIRYEVIIIGRNRAVRKYFDFLNRDYQKSSGVSHDHFANLKNLYIAFEYDSSHRQEFNEKYLFKYPNGII